MLWTDGAARVMPAWELYLGNYTIPGAFWVALLCGLMVVLLITYPFIEQKVTGDTAHHNLLQRPRDVPVRTGVGVMGLTFFLLLTLSGGNDHVAHFFQISLNAMTWVGRIGLIVLPPLAFFITYRLCIGLQRSDREVLEHGIETGVIKRLPNGAFVEIHQPLGPVDEHGHPVPLEYAGARVPKQMNQLGFADSDTIGKFSPAELGVTERVRDAEEQKHHEAVETMRALEATKDRSDRDATHENAE